MREQPSSLSRKELKRLSRREPRVVEKWFLLYADAVYTFIYYRAGRDRELASELVQDTFTSALDRIEDYDPERGDMLTWLAYTARNCIRASLRHGKRFETEQDFWERVDGRILQACRLMAVSPLPDEILQRRETADLVRIALFHLPEKYRAALVRHYFSQKSLREIARSEGITEGAVKSLLHRARLALKGALEALGESFEERTPAPRRVR